MTRLLYAPEPYRLRRPDVRIEAERQALVDSEHADALVGNGLGDVALAVVESDGVATATLQVAVFSALAPPDAARLLAAGFRADLGASPTPLVLGAHTVDRYVTSDGAVLVLWLSHHAVVTITGAAGDEVDGFAQRYFASVDER